MFIGYCRFWGFLKNQGEDCASIFHMVGFERELQRPDFSRRAAATSIPFSLRSSRNYRAFLPPPLYSRKAEPSHLEHYLNIPVAVRARCMYFKSKSTGTETGVPAHWQSFA